MNTNSFRDLLRQEAIDRDVDCVTHDLESLINRNAFKEVREVIQHATEYMAERIEMLEEQDEKRRQRA